MKEIITSTVINNNDMLKERQFDMSEETDINMYKQEKNLISAELPVPAIPLNE